MADSVSWRSRLRPARYWLGFCWDVEISRLKGQHEVTGQEGQRAREPDAQLAESDRGYCDENGTVAAGLPREKGFGVAPRAQHAYFTDLLAHVKCSLSAPSTSFAFHLHSITRSYFLPHETHPDVDLRV